MDTLGGLIQLGEGLDPDKTRGVLQRPKKGKNDMLNQVAYNQYHLELRDNVNRQNNFNYQRQPINNGGQSHSRFANIGQLIIGGRNQNDF